jgi:serine/threonine protein kinase
LSRDPSDDDELDDDELGDELDDDELAALGDLDDDVELEFWTKLRLAIVERATVHAVEGGALYDFQGYGCLSSFEGGMGLVIIAYDYNLERKVAIKVLKNTGKAAEAALLAEAQKLAKLDHQNVVTVYHVGKCEKGSLCEGSLYMVMEYVEGKDGSQWLRTRPNWQQIRDVFVDAAMGLAAAHDAGIHHRDFKPANMLVGKDGRTRVADFGVADKLREFANDDEPIVGPGTPDYMAPERLRGERGDARSDQFSFGVSLWRALHGLAVHGGENVFRFLESGASHRAGVVPRAVVGVPPWLTRVVLKALAHNPDNRYPNIHELVRALKGEPPDDEDEPDEPDDEDEPDEPEVPVLHSPTREPLAAPASGPVEPDVHVLHAPTSGPSPTDDRVRLAMLLSGGVATLAVLAVTFVATLVVLRLPATEHSPATSEESTTDPQHDVVLHQVIKLVEAGRLRDAASTWWPEYERRRNLGEPVYEETALIGEACLELARKHKKAGRIAEARAAARRAEVFGGLATQDFENHVAPPGSATGSKNGPVDTESELLGNPVDSGTDLVERVEQFVLELDQSKQVTVPSSLEAP